MKFKAIFFILLISNGLYAQNDSLQKERYEVIKALFKNDQPTLDKNFLQFMGIGLLISKPGLIDDLLGHCIDMDKKEIYSFSEIVTPEEISKMCDQISSFSYYRTIDLTMLSNNFTIDEDCENRRPAITLPLVYNNKAIVYLNNKKNSENLFVLIKHNNEWIVRCRKEIYTRIDD